MYKKIITTDILPINKLKIFALLFLFVFNSNFSFAQNSIKYNKVSFSAGVLHLFENNKNLNLSSKYKRLFNNFTFSLQYSFRISKDLSVGSRVIFNKFGKNQVVENNYSSLPVFFALNYRLIRRADLYLQYYIGPVFYFDKVNGVSLNNSKMGFGTAASTIYFFRIVNNLFINIEWGLSYENSIPKNVSNKSYRLYTFLNVGLAISF